MGSHAATTRPPPKRFRGPSLSGSTVSRGFIQASAAQLREFQERDLAGEDVVAIVLDGKTFADATLVIALGITLSGEKRLPRLRGDGHGERAGAHAVPAVVGRAGPRRRAGRAGDQIPGKGLRAAVRRRPSTTAPWSTGASGTSARTRCVTWPRVSRPHGASASSAPTTARRTPRRWVRSRRSTASSRTGTNPGRQSGGRAGRNPDAASPRAVRGAGRFEDDELSGVHQWRTSRNAVRRSITGRTRANGTAGWQPRSWTSNRARKVMGYRHLPALPGRAEARPEDRPNDVEEESSC